MPPSRIAITDHHTGGEPFHMVVGRTFTGRVLDTVEAEGRPAVIPEVTDMADRTREHVFSIDPHDPLVPWFVPR